MSRIACMNVIVQIRCEPWRKGGDTRVLSFWTIALACAVNWFTDTANILVSNRYCKM